jgi:GNAT superfamily N-acetyltransferase
LRIETQKTINVKGPLLDQASRCEPILRSLPDWFGIEESIVDYLRNIDVLTTYLAMSDGDPIGFMTVKHHFPQSAELYVLAVRPEQHRRGVGRMLLNAVERCLRDQKVALLQVKTLSPSRKCEHYERTRQFYLSMGFLPLEEIPTLWGPRNPCLLMAKAL